MQKRKIGALEVSPVGMGCMGFSHGYGAVPDGDYAADAIRAALDFGCTFFDTAEVYGREMFYAGHNEELVGRALEGRRQGVVLATKFFLNDDELDKPLYEVIKKHLEASLKRLKTDHIDLYYWHRINEHVSLEEVAACMGRLIKEGLISGWGLSQVGRDTIARAQAVTPLSAVQNLYSMMERDCESEVLPYCLENGIALVPFSPIASGFLSGRVTEKTVFEGDDVRKFIPQLSAENLKANEPVLKLLASFAERKNASLAQISLAWMLKKYPHVVPIPGSKNKERILENLGAWEVSLSDDEFKSLEEGLNSCTIYGHRGIEETQQKGFAQRLQKK